MIFLALDITPIALFTMYVFAGCMLLALVRLFLGPSMPDRIVALDLIAALAVGMMAIYSILTGRDVLLHAAVVVALIVFVGTVAFAIYLEKRGQS